VLLVLLRKDEENQCSHSVWVEYSFRLLSYRRGYKLVCTLLWT